MKHPSAIHICSIVLWALICPGSIAQEIALEVPKVFLTKIPFSVTVSVSDSAEPVDVAVLLGDGTLVKELTLEPSGSTTIDHISVTSQEQAEIRAEVGGEIKVSITRSLYPGFISILPPLIAILLALIFREVVSSLFAGIWIGCLFLNGFNPIQGIFDAGNRFARGALGDGDRAAIVLFTLMLGGMVGIMTRMGGMRAVVEAVAPLAVTRRSGQVVTWLSGVIIFFDDYANSLIIGNTMRPLTDRLKVSREKLAYIVDSTAAPVASLFVISTWIGYQLGLIGSSLELVAAQSTSDPALATEILSTTPFHIFLQTIPYMFYPIFTLTMVGAVAILGRDFGPMLRAEQRAVSGGGLYRNGAQLATDMTKDLEEVESAPKGRWWNGAVPIIVLITTVLWGLVTTGSQGALDGEKSLYQVFGDADPFSPLLWGATAACVLGLLLAVAQRILSLAEGIAAWVNGLRAMVMAVVILVLAWSLGSVTQALGTASFIIELLSDTLPPQALPAVVFLVSAAIAFATGTSWATMAILFPIVIPLSIAMSGGISPDTSTAQAVLFGAIGSVLAGSIMGDHCSPISDTTVLSSTASSCDHVDHVRTQLPYSVFVAFVALVLGSALSVFGISVWICLLLGCAVIVATVRFYGRKPDADVST